MSPISECTFHVGSGEGVGGGVCDHRLVDLESDRGDVVLGGKSTEESAEARANDAEGQRGQLTINNVLVSYSPGSIS